MFRQIRKPDTPPKDDHTHSPDMPSMDNHTHSETAVPTNHDADKDIAMETRIKQYIDTKLSELQLHLDNQLHLMKEDILTEIRIANS